MAVWAFDLVVLFEGVIARGEWEGFPAGLVRSFVSVSVSGYRVMVRGLIPRRKAVFASDTSRKGVKEYYRGGEAGRCTSAGFTAQPPTYRIAMVKGKKSPSFGGSGMLQLERNELKRAAAKKPWRRDIETVPRSQRSFPGSRRVPVDHPQMTLDDEDHQSHTRTILVLTSSSLFSQLSCHPAEDGSLEG
ncbi:hypothetical protein K438DRAFT_1755779 [Mycena galopus ATCC 62051]|nr:hypothetical protein K438DRAFT_1755779 [Mycena galopus ATCC 62051]